MRLINIDDDRNCYIGNDGEYEKYNIALDVLAEARHEGKWVLKKKLVPLPWDSSPLDYDNYDKKTHSEWKESYYCSECDWEVGEFATFKFCPECGSCMTEVNQ